VIALLEFRYHLTAWMKHQEEINRLLRMRVEKLERLDGAANSPPDRRTECGECLTAAEREAVEVAAQAYADDHGERFAATLRGLLSRTGSIGAKAGDETTETNANSANVPERDCFGSAANSQPILRDGCGECLTESEREAVAEASDFYVGTRTGVTLRALLKRMEVRDE